MSESQAVASTRSPAETPYKLDPAQTLRASGALLKHIISERKSRESKATKKNLLAAGSDGSDGEGGGDAEVEPIQLVITTKKQIVKEKSLKPRKIPVPHTLNDDAAVASICLITPDPQRAFKDALADEAFPAALAAKVRVLGAEKLKSRYKSFEQRRQLRDAHDVFLADDRIVPLLPGALGKIFFESGAKRPLPVSLSVRQKDAAGKTVKVSEKKINSNRRTRDGEGQGKTPSMLHPAAFAREIERTLSCAQVHLTPSVTTSVRVGFSSFSAQQLADNIAAVVQGMTDKYIAKGWRSVRAIHVKGPKTTSLTIWQTPELWEEDADVIEDADAQQLKEIDAPGRKRRTVAGENGNDEDGNDDSQDHPGGERRGKKQKLLSGSTDNGGVAQSRQTLRQGLRQQKSEAKRAIAALT